VPGPVVSVSIDLDAVECYFRIHALPGPVPEQARHLILQRCLPRFAELFAKHGVRATFFVVGRDLEDDRVGRDLLVRLGGATIAQEIDRAHAAIASAAGAPPVGFRCPGYEVTDEVIALLCDRSYAYDSSAFPSIPYYTAKAAVMGAMRLAGRRSGSILGSPKVLRAPTAPYHPAEGDAYARGDRPILELPMSVTPWLRLPVIGTSVVAAPEPLRRRIVASAMRTPLFNFELHGIDLADAEADGFPPQLIAMQPDLRVTLARKLAALEATLVQAREAGARLLPLREAITALPVSA
jgi:peptidoglycan/xylan/chitin deacetylase (PgdA/CDA1 family)